MWMHGHVREPGLLRWRCARYWRSAIPLEFTGCVESVKDDFGLCLSSGKMRNPAM